MKKIVSTLVVMLLCFSVAVTAQVRPVTGTVKDDSGRLFPMFQLRLRVAALQQ